MQSTIEAPAADGAAPPFRPRPDGRYSRLGCPCRCCRVHPAEWPG